MKKHIEAKDRNAQTLSPFTSPLPIILPSPIPCLLPIALHGRSDLGFVAAPSQPLPVALLLWLQARGGSLLHRTPGACSSPARGPSSAAGRGAGVQQGHGPLKENKSWKFWICPICDRKRFVDSGLLLSHMCGKHPKGSPATAAVTFRSSAQ